jgi:hypothetical protein
MTTATVPCVFLFGKELREPLFTRLVTDGDQTIVVTNSGVPTAIIRPFAGEEEAQYLSNLDLLTVSLRELGHYFGIVRRRIETQGGGQAAITRISPRGQRNEELLKLITLLDAKQGERLATDLHAGIDTLSELTKFRA